MVICLGGITAYTTFVVTLLIFCLFLIHTFISLDIEERIFHSSNDTSNSTGKTSFLQINIKENMRLLSMFLVVMLLTDIFLEMMETVEALSTCIEFLSRLSEFI